MKKNYKLVIKAIVFLTLLGSSYACKREIVSEQSNLNRAVLIHTCEKTSNDYVLFVFLGHDATGCPGCILFNGKRIHVNCQGRGNACYSSAAVSLNQVGADLTATTTDTFGLTSEDFFNMPDRSLSYTEENNNEIFLNIPAQLVFRDPITQQFTFTGLFFSDAAEYTND